MMPILRLSQNQLFSQVKNKINGQYGFTLVELMIALVIGLVLLLVIGTVFVSSNQAFRVQDNNARLQESGRFALEMLGRSIKQSGNSVIPFSGNKVLFEGVAIGGTDGIAGAADTLTIQYEGLVGEQDCEGTGIGASGDIIQNHFNLDVANAELQCEGSSATLPAVPPLPAAPPTGNPLLSNVEDFQVLYGIDTTLDQSANQYVAVPADWSQVITARVCVLIRSEDTNIVNAGSSFRDCNGAVVAALADRRLRRAFTSTFNLRNRINVLP